MRKSILLMNPPKYKKDPCLSYFFEKMLHFFKLFSKTPLTSRIFDDIIVNCIIIACTIDFWVQVGQEPTKSAIRQGFFGI